MQSIENLSPEDPVASELAAIKQRVDQIYSILPTPTRSGSGYQTADIISLMNLVESLTKEGFVSERDLENLITDTTSERFDEWVRRVINKLSPRRPEEDYDDIPF